MWTRRTHHGRPFSAQFSLSIRTATLKLFWGLLSRRLWKHFSWNCAQCQSCYWGRCLFDPSCTHNLMSPSHPLTFFLPLSVQWYFPFIPLKVKLLAGDLRAAQLLSLTHRCLDCQLSALASRCCSLQPSFVHRVERRIII